MTHDPLCPSVTACDCRHDECCFCDSDVWCLCRFIEKVRADERNKLNTPWWSAEYHRGYRQGYDDAVKKGSNG